MVFELEGNQGLTLEILSDWLTVLLRLSLRRLNRP